MLSVHSNPAAELGKQDNGGMSVHILELSRELGKAGFKVDIFTCRKGVSGGREETVSRNVRLIHLRNGGNGNLIKQALLSQLPDAFTLLDAYRMRNSLRYSLIHSHYWLSGRLGSWAGRLWRVPHLLTLHTNGMAKKINCPDERESSMRLMTEKRLARECARVFAPTEKEKELLMRFYGMPGEKIGLVPSGVNLDLFRPMPKEKARNLAGIRGDGKVVLYVGRFSPVKGIDRLIATMAHLRRRHRFRLVIVGGDGQRARETVRIAGLSRSFCIHNHVTFAGRIDHRRLAAYYNAADLLVVPSHYESFGLVALESLACGTPVVATRVGVMDSIIRDGETGMVVDSPDPLSLSKAVENFFRRSGRLSREEVRATVLKHCWSNVAETVTLEYVGIFNETKAPFQERSLKA
jgi:D-inositol-3-phosphate glycosyltransferase